MQRDAASARLRTSHRAAPAASQRRLRCTVPSPTQAVLPRRARVGPAWHRVARAGYVTHGAPSSAAATHARATAASYNKAERKGTAARYNKAKTERMHRVCTGQHGKKGCMPAARVPPRQRQGGSRAAVTWATWRKVGGCGWAPLTCRDHTDSTARRTAQPRGTPPSLLSTELSRRRPFADGT